MNIEFNNIIVALACFLMLYAAVGDWKNLKIKNIIVFLILVLGFAHAGLGNSPGASIAMSGVMFIATLFMGFIFFMIGGWGAGDAKLFSTSSIFLDAYGVILYFFGSLVISLIIGFVYLFKKRKTKKISIKQILKERIPFAPGMFFSFLLSVGILV